MKCIFCEKQIVNPNYVGASDCYGLWECTESPDFDLTKEEDIIHYHMYMDEKRRRASEHKYYKGLDEKTRRKKEIKRYRMINRSKPSEW